MIKLFRVSVLVFSLAAVQSAHAVLLKQGVLTSLPGTVSPGGVVILDDDKDFSFVAYGGVVSGHVQSRVVRKVDGTLLFAWRVFNSAGSSGGIGSFRLGEFFAGYYDGDSDPSSPIGSAAGKLAIYLGNGNVNFYFRSRTEPSDLLPGVSSQFVYLDTNSTQYTELGLYDLTNNSQTEISGLFSTFAPVPVPVPEPASASLVALGGLLMARRRRS